MSTVFITGTDTDIGKTVFTGLYAKHLLDTTSQSVVTQKWIQTGFQPDGYDIQIHYKLMQQQEPQSLSHKKAMMPYTFTLASSAHLAAKHDKKIIHPTKISSALRFLEHHYDTVLIEGLGGIHVPISDQLTCLDLVEQLKLSTIIVVGNKVGCINHALLTINAIAQRHIPIQGFIMNHLCKDLHPLIAEDNAHAITRHSGVSCLGEVDINQHLTLYPREFHT